jgi:hypothetical protein
MLEKPRHGMPHAGVNEHVNFANFVQAALLLLRVATGDNW